MERKNVDNKEMVEGEAINNAILSTVAEQRNVYAAESRMTETPIKQGKGR